VAKVFRHECGGIRVEPAIANVRQAVTARVHVAVGQQVRTAAVLLGEVRTEGNQQGHSWAEWSAITEVEDAEGQSEERNSELREAEVEALSRVDV
jgi:hypothetical protein